jgi:hypothetical protein
VHLSKERFPPGRHAKIKQHGDGPFRIVKCMSDNAYKVGLSVNYGASATFNVEDLTPYFEDDVPNLCVSSFQPRKNDVANIQMNMDLNSGQNRV